MKKWFIASLIVATTPGHCLASDIYIYRESDGTKWFTDHHINRDGFTLIGRHGRPTAVASCRGVNPTVLESRAQQYMPTITRYADQFRVDQALVKAIIAVESCFDASAVSRVGAQGLMQLMPGTAQELGVSNAFNPQENIRGGVDYFSRMLRRFGNDTKLALAAYNAGPGAVDRHGGIPPYRETQGYVQKVLAQYERYRPISLRD
ncbi:MAG: lytic transglycosylase domain-containing protein [Ectothiorhodospiraceae bacterium]|jgi:soluble lytic murein transglycosylase-like protein|nr:lytic transglycosylase domain-containing protein [Ectothiorhodospiraceae bacterium]